MGRKRGFSAEKKMEAILAMLRKEETINRIARRHGVSEQSLYRWYDDFLEGGKAALSGSIDKGLKAENTKLKKDIEERDRVIGEITIANEIMKKKLPLSY
jgi:transposase-like protein